MPRDSSGNYTLPAGNPVISGTTITSNWANTTMPDIGNEITDSLSRSGQGGMLAPLFFADGNVNAPGMAFVLEPTLGWFRPSTSVMALAALGNTFWSFNTTDNALSLPEAGAKLGVGIAIPEASLHVVGGRTKLVTVDEAFTLALGRVGTTNFYHLGVSDDVSPSLIFANNGGIVSVRILDNGNVGIGTADPNEQLSISGTTPRIEFIATDTGAVGKIDAQSGSGSLAILVDINSVGSSPLFNVVIQGNNIFTALANSNCGINNVDPKSLLHVFKGSSGTLPNPAANVVIENSSQTGLNMITGNSVDNWIMFGDTDDNFMGGFRYRHNGDDLSFYANKLISMQLTAVGNVVVTAGGLIVGANNNSLADNNILVDEGIYIGAHTGNQQIVSVSTGGGSSTLFIGNQSINTTSDIRIKKGVVDTEMDALDMLDRVRVVDHNWDDPADKSYNNRNARGKWTSIIAQELVEIFPFAVNAPRRKSDLSIDYDSENRWLVNQDQLVPVLIKSTQQIKARLESLESKFLN